jgi:hypothetical protein
LSAALTGCERRVTSVESATDPKLRSVQNRRSVATGPTRPVRGSLHDPKVLIRARACYDTVSTCGPRGQIAPLPAAITHRHRQQTALISSPKRKWSSQSPPDRTMCVHPTARKIHRSALRRDVDICPRVEA